MWRQGDIYIQKLDGSIPSRAKRLDPCVIAEGETTGHRHQVADWAET
jgi:hypothetical protein